MNPAICTLILLCSCGASVNDPPAPPPCDQLCQDNVAGRALRQVVKLGYNLTLQAKPVGVQNAIAPCPQGGFIHIFGTGTSDALQGATLVDLTYDFAGCVYFQTDPEAAQNYKLTVTGTVTEKGTLAAQPTSLTAIYFDSAALTIDGTVYAPPLPYRVEACKMAFVQNGSRMDGLLCGRDVNVSF